jgi:hypothetical protein
MSAALVQAVLAADIKPAHAKLVAFVLAWHARDADGHAWPSVGTLERECAMSRRHVKRAIGQLLSAGVITVVRPSKGGAHAATTVYMVAVEAPGKDANPVRGRTRCADAPGAPASADPVRPRLPPGAPAHPKNNEKRETPSASLSLSLKKRGTASPLAVGADAPPRGKPAARRRKASAAMAVGLTERERDYGDEETFFPKAAAGGTR